MYFDSMHLQVHYIGKYLIFMELIRVTVADARSDRFASAYKRRKTELPIGYTCCTLFNSESILDGFNSLCRRYYIK